ncbi:MAG: hypothetical protein H8E44_46015 [Planctomycetes bacterium]|nr:hypothetical protein [Planctomycetota bacterium]
MSMEAASTLLSRSRFERLRLAREIIRVEGQAPLSLSERLSEIPADTSSADSGEPSKSNNIVAPQAVLLAD